MRVESRERRLGNDDLEHLWDRNLAEAQQQVESSMNINEMVQLLSDANFSIELAKIRQLKPWDKSWALIKYQIMVDAIEHRARGVEDIEVGVFPPPSETDSHMKEIVVGFLVKPKTYYTRTSLQSLSKILPRNQILVLVGYPDERINNRYVRPLALQGRTPTTRVP